MDCVFCQVLENTNAEEVMNEVILYSILFLVIGVVTGLGMFLQVRDFQFYSKEEYKLNI
jgi:hypothetical protein